MDPQRLSYLLDTLIDDLLAQRKKRFQQHDKVMRVVLSGDCLTALPDTLDCLTALNAHGYLLVIASSHSAIQSTLHSACLAGLAQRGVDVLCDNQEPWQDEATYSSLYLPALSSNSLSKIALGIRDNLVCRWAFHALNQHKPVMVTLNHECRPDVPSALPSAFRARLSRYVSTLVEYGFTVIGQPRSAAPRRPTLITLSDARQHPQGQPLSVSPQTLITPAAQDEIRRRGIIIVQS